MKRKMAIKLQSHVFCFFFLIQFNILYALEKCFSNSWRIHENFTQSDNPIPSCEWAFKHRQNTEVFDANTSSNTSVSSTLIKQSPSPTTAPDWFIAFHLRSHFKNSFRVFDQRYQNTRKQWISRGKTPRDSLEKTSLEIHAETLELVFEIL